MIRPAVVREAIVRKVDEYECSHCGPVTVPRGQQLVHCPNCNTRNSGGPRLLVPVRPRRVPVVLRLAQLAGQAAASDLTNVVERARLQKALRQLVEDLEQP